MVRRSTLGAAAVVAGLVPGAASAQPPAPAATTPAAPAPAATTPGATAAPAAASPAVPSSARRLSLNDAMALARTRSEGVGVARASERRARSAVRAARSSLLPQLNGTAAYDRTLESEYEGLFEAPAGTEGENLAELPFGQRNVWRIGLQLTQELWSFGRTTGRMAMARAAAEQAEVGLTSAGAQAAYLAAQAYFDALLADAVATIAERTLAQAEETVRTTTLGFQQGASPEFDVLRAEVTRDNQRSAVAQRRSERELALLRLRQVLGLPLGEPLALTTALETPEVAEADATPSRRRDRAAGAIAAPPLPVPSADGEIAAAEAGAGKRATVRQARAALAQQDAAVGVARAGHLPSIGLVSNWGVVNYPADLFPGTKDWRTNWTVGVLMTVPLFAGFRVDAEVDGARADRERAVHQVRDATRAAAVDEVASRQQAAVAATVLQQSGRTVAQAERAYKIAELRFTQGISTHLDLVDARLLLDQARVNQARAARDVHVSAIRLELLPDLPPGGAPSAGTPTSGPSGSMGGAAGTGAAGANDDTGAR
jgi:outer membrane protein